MAVVEHTSIFAAPAEHIWDYLERPELLEYVTAPLMKFTPTEPRHFPERWSEQTYLVHMWFLGVIPFGSQFIKIERPQDSGPTRFIRDNGHSARIKRWDHLISITPLDPKHTKYTDRVEIDAGIWTPIVWAFATIFYAHRQRRWRNLIANNFQKLRGATCITESSKNLQS